MIIRQAMLSGTEITMPQRIKALQPEGFEIKVDHQMQSGNKSTESLDNSAPGNIVHSGPSPCGQPTHLTILTKYIDRHVYNPFRLLQGLVTWWGVILFVCEWSLLPVSLAAFIILPVLCLTDHVSSEIVSPVAEEMHWAAGRKDVSMLWDWCMLPIGQHVCCDSWLAVVRKTACDRWRMSKDWIAPGGEWLPAESPKMIWDIC